MFVPLSRKTIKILKCFNENKYYRVEEINLKLNLDRNKLDDYLIYLKNNSFLEESNTYDEDDSLFGLGYVPLYKRTALGVEYLEYLEREKIIFFAKTVLVPIIITLITNFVTKKLYQ
jgi:hypothetical protein